MTDIVDCAWTEVELSTKAGKRISGRRFTHPSTPNLHLIHKVMMFCVKRV
ncbi:hypothetical protein HanHA300_Chr02g0062781 [Helianthus annuus]|nr:hypothetical protein HanHA300_Chr02g0062781 [Helianthus annuus]KAJ0619429.1 hypothetical protein HanHA89_Chr02g0071291 [Helianthus annuus]KAJ0777888.1 hypothetical protein HanLR1_Chr02g0065611 [Helianthus annuus]